MIRRRQGASPSTTHWNDDQEEPGLQSFDDSMEPEDVAAGVVYALTQPKRVNVSQIVLMQSSML